MACFQFKQKELKKKKKNSKVEMHLKMWLGICYL